MEVAASTSNNMPVIAEKLILLKKINLGYWLLLSFNCFSMFVGSIASSLLSRFYFIHGGSSRWLSTWVQSAGFPLLLPPIFLSPGPKPFSLFSPRLFFISLGVGLLTGVNNFLISWGVSYLPVSTYSLLLSSQLAFNLLLSVLLVKQKLCFTNINCVMLLTLSSVLLALDSGHDHPRGVTGAQFFLGFAAVLAAAALFALYLPVMEIAYRRVRFFKTVVEMQVLIQTVATLFATAGMAAAGGLAQIKAESRRGFDLGEGWYWAAAALTVVTWQMCFLGTAGVVYQTTALTGGVCMTALLPMNVGGGVVAFKDEFGGQKAVSTALCLWGFASYLYGQFQRQKKDAINGVLEAESAEENADSAAV